MLTTIALVKEIESPENPGGLEKRVALIPSDVQKLTASGVKVFVESGAGEGVGFSDAEYLAGDATMQSADQIYRDKDLIIKFKGPALESIPQMKKNSILFCMAHFDSFPQRAQLLKDHCINVIAMEEVLESPKNQTDEQILARVAMAAALQPFIDNKTIAHLKVVVIGYNDRLAGAIRRAGNRNPWSLEIVNEDVQFEELPTPGKDTLYVYDGLFFNPVDNILDRLQAQDANVFDIHAFELSQGAEAIAAYKDSHVPFEFGLRRIQCLQETGQAGARYGLKLLNDTKPGIDITDAKVVVLGYGNVARGAMYELYSNGVKTIHVLGRTHTTAERVEHWLEDVDLVVNGADLPIHLRGKTYLVTNEHIKNTISTGSVIIDLVSGSEANRSGVEAVLNATFLTDPFFVQDGVTIASLWGWPMMEMNRESTERYSSQITDVLIGKEHLLKGLHSLALGVQRALVCGPFGE